MKETEKENGRKAVDTWADDEEKEAVNGPSTRGRMAKMRRGTASHKTAQIEVFVDLDNGKRSVQNIHFNTIKRLDHHAKGTYQSMVSNFLTQRAVIFNLSLTLVVGNSAYLSSSEMGRTLASHQGNWAGSVGTSPYAIRTR